MKLYGRAAMIKLLLLGSVLLLMGLPACQTTTHVIIGVVNLSPRLEPVLTGFQAGLAAQGYVEGESVTYLYEGPAASIEELDAKVQVLLAAEVDLIVAISTPAAQAAHRLTRATQTPVVFGPVTDPIAAGVVESLPRPGGNVTGVRLGAESEEERLEWLLKTDPRIQTIYIPYNPEDDSAVSSVTAVTGAAARLDITPIIRQARDDTEITEAVAAVPENADAIMLPQDSLVAARIDDFVAVAIGRQLPLSSPTDEQVQRGALIAYSFRLHEIGLQMARLADQILRGTPPEDLPVETAEFFLTVNLQTAVAIDLRVPDAVLQSADAIIR